MNMNILHTMNLELTNKCPLCCPQCYCSLEGEKNLDLKTALFWIKEGSKMGVKEVMLSGGETMCYPYLYEVIKAAAQYCGNANVALSGFDFTQEVYEKMVSSNISGIFISLNGSTNEINSITRDGYELAIMALEILKINNFKNTTINWVMHSNNADDFENIIKIAEKYGVANIVIMAVKPDSKKMLSTVPSKEQMIEVKNKLMSYKGNVKIYVESCFSPMLALICDTKLFGNMNLGINKGCGAGRTTFSVNIDGLLSPCRHLEFYEKFDSLIEYWENSKILNTIRGIENNRQFPCGFCRYMDYCRHCLAINSKIHHDLYIGNEFCPIYESRDIV